MASDRQKAQIIPMLELDLSKLLYLARSIKRLKSICDETGLADIEYEGLWQKSVHVRFNKDKFDEFISKRTEEERAEKLQELGMVLTGMQQVVFDLERLKEAGQVEETLAKYVTPLYTSVHGISDFFIHQVLEDPKGTKKFSLSRIFRKENPLQVHLQAMFSTLRQLYKSEEHYYKPLSQFITNFQGHLQIENVATSRLGRLFRFEDGHAAQVKNNRSILKDFVAAHIYARQTFKQMQADIEQLKHFYGEGTIIGGHRVGQVLDRLHNRFASIQIEIASYASDIASLLEWKIPDDPQGGDGLGIDSFLKSIFFEHFTPAEPDKQYEEWVAALAAGETSARKRFDGLFVRAEELANGPRSTLQQKARSLLGALRGLHEDFVNPLRSPSFASTYNDLLDTIFQLGKMLAIIRNQGKAIRAAAKAE